MCRRRRDQLDPTGLAVVAERADNVAIEPVPQVAQTGEVGIPVRHQRNQFLVTGLLQGRLETRVNVFRHLEAVLAQAICRNIRHGPGTE